MDDKFTALSGAGTDWGTAPVVTPNKAVVLTSKGLYRAHRIRDNLIIYEPPGGFVDTGVLADPENWA